MRIVVDWSQDGTASPASALSGGSEQRRAKLWSKGTSWLSSVTRHSSVRRTQQKLHGWLSSESLLGGPEPAWQTAAASADDPPQRLAAAGRRASFAEFYPGQLQLGSRSLPREPEPRPPARSAADRYGTMRGEGSVRRVPAERPRYPHVAPLPQQRPARGLFRSLSISGHLSELSTAGGSAQHGQFHRNSNLRRSRSRDDLLSLRPGVREPGKVVYHYPPNGVYCRPVVLVPRTAEPPAAPAAPAPRPGPLRRAESLSHGLKSRSLGTLLEERTDPSPSPSPLPLPVLDLAQVSSPPGPTRCAPQRPTAELTPLSPPQTAYYPQDDFLPPLAEENSSKGSSEGEQERRSSSGRTSGERHRSSAGERRPARPHVATFSSPSPESPERPSWTPPHGASPLYSTLEEGRRGRDGLSDHRLRHGHGNRYGGYGGHSGYSGHGGHSGYSGHVGHSGYSGHGGHSDSFVLRAPPGMHSAGSAADGSLLAPVSPPCPPPQLDYPPFVTPEGSLSDERHRLGEGQRRREVELIRAAYRARFEQRRRFPAYLQPAFVPVDGGRAGSWHERNPLPAPAPRRAPLHWPHEPPCSCHHCPSGAAAAAERAWKRRSYADPRHSTFFENQGNLTGEVTTIPGRSHISQARGLSKKNGIIVNERLPVLSGKRPQPNGTGHVSSGRGLPIIQGSSPPERSHSSRTDAQGRPLPLKPSDAVRYYGSYMSEYELSEVEQYEEVWFLGLDANKVAGDEALQQNGGFDDEHGSYVKVPHDHIAYRYEILEVIGRGSFGQVIRALDHKTNTQVAIKIIRNKKRFHQQALMEVKILDHLRRRDKEGTYNIIHMLDYFYFRNHLCVTFQLMGLNLFELIKKNNYQGVSMSLIRKFATSMIQCLRLLYKEGIIHCDLKPENVLLKSRSSSSIKIIDFGSSCYTHQRVYTYIQSRFYRSPEVILGLQYGTAIDMWSLGCILAELHTGFPLFPGENEVEQLACIMEVLHLPPDDLIMHATRRRLFFDSRGNPRSITNTKGRRRRPGSRPLIAALKSNDAVFVDFIDKCLTWDPAQRLTPEEAVRHPFLGGRSSALPPPPPPVAAASADEAAFSIYKIYRGRKPARELATAATVEAVGAGAGVSRQEGRRSSAERTERSERGGADTASDQPAQSSITIGAAAEPASGSAPRAAADEREKTAVAASSTQMSAESAHEDGGTFLPPIL